MRDWHKEAKRLESARNKAQHEAEQLKREIQRLNETNTRLRRELKTTVTRLERMLRWGYRERPNEIMKSGATFTPTPMEP
jgi:septal ring factor EnvC (AmiA/AmiB activator)